MGSRSTALGLVVAAGSLAVTTAVLFPLEQIASPVSLGVLYLLAVLLVSTLWGLWLGLATSVAALPASTSSTSRRRGASRSPKRRTGWRSRCS